MSSFNKTYLQTTSKQKTIRAIDFIYRQLRTKLDENFYLITVSPPIFDEIGSPTLLNLDENRQINIDLIQDYQVVTFYQSLSLWAKKCIDEYGIKINEGIIFVENSIWRDTLSNPKVSQHKSYIHIELLVNKSNKKQEILKKITNKIYSIIFNIAQQLNNKYKISNIFPKKIEFIESQLLENEFPNLSFYNREAEVAEEHKAFVLMQPGKKLFSGAIHAKRSTITYDNDHYNEIHLYDENDGTSLNVISIAYKKPYINKSKTSMSNDDKPKTKNNKGDNIEIKINLFKLYLVLLKKGHIAEVQPNVISKEAIHLHNKHMIEKL